MISSLALLLACAALFLSLRREWKEARRRRLISRIEFERFDERAKLPVRGSERSAGLDLSSIEELSIPPGGHATVRTGLGIMIPRIAEEEGYYARIAPRSGLAKNHGLDVLGGVVDEDFPQEMRIILKNNDDAPFHIRSGDRIAQLLLESIIYPQAHWSNRKRQRTDRTGGFGSTGV